MKLVVVVRKDLKMPAGKAIAQAVHAVHGMRYPLGAAVVVLRVDSEEQLERLISEYDGHPVVDAGRTVFKEPTLTCAAFVCEDDAFSELGLY